MPVLSNTIFLVMVGIVGLLVGLLIGYLFADREPKKGKDDGIPADLRKDGFSDVARLLYSPSKKRIMTGMDGAFFHEAKELTPDQRIRLSKVIRIWTDWSNKLVETEAAPAPETSVAAEEPTQTEPLVAPAEVQTLPPEQSAMTEPVQPANEAFDRSSFFEPEEEPVTNAEGSSEPARPFVELDNEEAPAVPESVVEPEVEPVQPVVKNQTIVEQINEILQGKLAGTTYEARGLTLQDDLHNGVVVFVGGEKYTGIELVPYPDAQKLITDSVAEWQQKFEAEQNPSA